MRAGGLPLLIAGAGLAAGAAPSLVAKIPLPDSTGHFDHVVGSAEGVAFMATKSNVSFDDEEGEVTAVRYAEGPHGVVGLLPIKGCNPQGIVVPSTGTVVTACDGSGDVAVLGWDGAALSLKGSVSLPGEADDIYVLSNTTLVVADGAALATVSIADPATPAVVRTIDTQAHPEAFRQSVKGAWVINVPDLGEVQVASPKGVVRRWDLNATTGCDGGNYAMAAPTIGGEMYVVIACRAAPVAKLMVWAAQAVVSKGAGAPMPKPLCELKAYGECDDLHATESGAVFGCMGTSPEGHIMKYRPTAAAAAGGCPLEVEWEVATPGTGSRTCELDEKRGYLLLASPSPGGYNGTSRGDAFLSVYDVRPL